MKRILTAGLLLLGLALPACTVRAQQPRNVQAATSSATRNDITADLNFPSGRTLLLKSGGTLTLSGAVGGTPTGGTLNLSALTLTLPATVSGGGSSFQTLDADLTALAALSGTDTIYYRSGASTWTPVTIGSGLTFAGGTLTSTGGLGSGDIDTSAELRAIVTDETGTGALVFATDPIILTPNAAMGALAIDVTKKRNTKTATTDHTWTFSATPSAGTVFGVVITGHSAATTQTIPSSWSLARQSAITTFTLPANAKVELTWVYDGTTYFLAGDPTTINDLSTITAITGDYVALHDASAGTDGKATIANVVLTGLPAFTGDATSSAGASALTLATVNSNVGTFGSATASPQITVNAKGLVTAASDVTITPAVGSITGLGTGVATALAINTGSAGSVLTNGGSLDGSGSILSSASTTVYQEFQRPAGNAAGVLFKTGTASRWAIIATSTAEGGSNAGSNLDIARYSDAGSYLDSPFSITRSTGIPVFGALTSNGLLTTTGGTGTLAVTVPGTGVLDALAANANAAGGFVTGTGTATLTNKTIAYGSNTITGLPETWVIPIGDETTAITTGTAKVTFRAPYACTVTAVRASLTTVSSSGLPTFDINEAGATILSTKLTIDASEKTSTTAATAAVISDSALADDAELTIDIDTAGTGAAGAKITIYVTRS